MQYYTIHKFAKMLGLTPQTLRNWDNQGKLHPDHIGSNGYRYYSDEQLNQVLNRPRYGNQIVIGYCRVSSQKQKDDLDRQVENVRTYLISQGQPFEIITDIGSGINYNKPGLRTLLQKINQGLVSKIVVLYKDRLLRYGFELIEYVASLYGTSIEVIDKTEKSQQQELVEDLVQIITVFSCRLQGQRAKKTKQMIKELTEVSDE